MLIIWYLMTGFTPRDDLIEFQEEYGVVIPLSLLEEAFTHPSYKTIDKSVKTYEQLETLGDSVIDLIVTKQLIEEDPNIGSGELTESRSMLVNNQTLSELGNHLGVDQLLRVSNEYSIGERDIADAIEALFGAIYLNSGIQACEAFYDQIKLVLLSISDSHQEGEGIYYNPVGRLQEFAQKRQLPLPKYDLIEQDGPDHDPTFTVTVSLHIDENTLEEEARGDSKKKARIAAAALLLEDLAQLGLLRHS